MEDFHKATTFNIRPMPTSKQSESQSLHVPFFGVFDGHGGRKAANFAAENLGQNIMDALANIHLSGEEVVDEIKRKNSIEEAVRAGYLKTDEGFLSKGTDMVSGTTCVSALIIGNLLVVSNAGDSRAVISRRRGEAEALTCDHNPGRPDEQQRIEKRGGYVYRIGTVWRVQGGLAVSRAIGDANFKQLISAEPDTTIIPITGDCDFLILASDGLWDKVSDQKAVDIAKPFCLQNEVPEVNRIPLVGPSSACQKLVEVARARGSNDDITVMIVQLSHFLKAEKNL